MLQMPGRWSQVLAVLIACTYTLNTPIRNLGIDQAHACMQRISDVYTPAGPRLAARAVAELVF